MKLTALLLALGTLAGLTSVGCAAPDAAASDSTEAAAADSTGSLADVMPLAVGDTHSAITPMGVHFERFASKVPTADERAFLADAAQSPAIPPSVSGLHLETFPVDLYPHGLPSPSDINQHAIGDCSAASVWASMAMQAPGFVQSLIDDHGDGTFGVRVYDPAGRRFTINVDSQFIARSANDLEAVSAKDGRADWATVLEKAAMKYLAVYPIVGRIGGIGSEFASPIFTGSGDSYAFSPGTLTPAQLTRVVREELAHGKIIIGGFNRVTNIGDLDTVTAHAYMIADPADAATMVTMRNPWGASPRAHGGYDTTRDGLIDVPATIDWSRTVDLRIISPGAAGTDGITEAYEPPTHAAPMKLQIDTE